LRVEVHAVYHGRLCVSEWNGLVNVVTSVWGHIRYMPLYCLPWYCTVIKVLVSEEFAKYREMVLHVNDIEVEVF
jgi:hypothetical protein